MKLQEDFDNLLNKLETLEALFITDRDGEIVIKSVKPTSHKKLLEPSFTASFVLGSDQLTKLGTGKNKSICCCFEEYDIVQFNFKPLVLTMISSANGNLDLLHEIGFKLGE